jgi:hypothetical protein
MMKLRIRGNSIRLRLGRGEVAALVEGGKVENSTAFGDGQRFGYALKTSGEITAPRASFHAGRIEVLLPTRLAMDWAASHEVGISGQQPVDTDEEQGGSLALLIEKDFACLKAAPEDDQSDAFPHPGSAACKADE